MKKQKTLKIIVILTILIIPAFGNFSVQAAPTIQSVSQPWRQVSYSSGNNISMLNASDGWQIQNAGTRAFLSHWDGTAWRESGEVIHSQDIVRSDIEIISETDGWITLGGPLGQEAESSIYRWNGNTWTLFDTLTDPNEISIGKLSMISATDGWALANSAFGSFLYHWDGSTWSKERTIWLNENFIDKDISMVSSTDGWAIGETIYRFDGNVWEESSGLPTINTSLLAIDMISANDGWIVGNEGTILHWDGSSWNFVSSPINATLTGVSMASANYGWAIGGGYSGPSVLLHWNGTNWIEMDCPTNAEFYDIVMISEYDGWLTTGWSDTEPWGTFRFNPTSLEINHNSGAVGSYLNITGEGFPPNALTTISINDELISNSLSTDASGTIRFTLNTDLAENGVYYVTVSVNPESTTRFILAADETQYPLEESLPLLEVPENIALKEIYLPLTLK